MRLDQLVPYIFLTGGLLIGVSIFWYLRLWERGQEDRWDAARPEAPPPAELAGPRRLPRLFLVGFALCVLSGPLVLWLLISRGDVTGPGAALDRRIERVLAQRLPDLETRQRHHEELIQAIREARGLPPGVTGGARGPLPAPSGETGGGAAGTLSIRGLQAAGYVAAPGGRYRLAPHVRFPQGAALLSTVAAVFLLAAGAITLANMDRAWGRLLGLSIGVLGIAIFVTANPELVTYSLAPARGSPAMAAVVPSEEPPQLPAAASSDREPAIVPAVRLECIGRLGPFEAGRHSLDSSAPDSLRRELAAMAAEGRVAFVLLIGRTDKQTLGLDARGVYGSILGLAQARAEWVREQLLRGETPLVDPGRVLALPGGPRHVGVDPAPRALAEDRAVDVYVCRIVR